MHVITEEEYMRAVHNGCELVARVTFSDQEAPLYLQLEDNHTLNDKITEFLSKLGRGDFQNIRIEYIFKNTAI